MINNNNNNENNNNNNNNENNNNNNNNNDNNNNNNNNLLLITKLTIKTYLQLISLKKKKKFSQSTIYKSFHFISSSSFRLKMK